MILFYLCDDTAEILSIDSEFKEYILSKTSNIKNNVVRISKEDLEDYLERHCTTLSVIKPGRDVVEIELDKFTDLEYYVLTKNSGQTYTLYKRKYTEQDNGEYPH